MILNIDIPSLIFFSIYGVVILLRKLFQVHEIFCVVGWRKKVVTFDAKWRCLWMGKFSSVGFGCVLS